MSNLCPFTGKSSYDDAYRAKVALKKMLRDPAHTRDKGTRLMVYKCGSCKKYHIGSTALKRRDGDESEYNDEDGTF